MSKVRTPADPSKTSQTRCYDNRSEIAPAKPSPPFYGQDTQFFGNQWRANLPFPASATRYYLLQTR